MGQKGLLILKISIFWPKIAVFSGFFSLTELGGTPPPLTESHCAQKSLAETKTTSIQFYNRIGRK